MHQQTNISLKGINKLAIPAIIAGIAEPLLSITDTAVVGNIDYNATEALAAVGIAGSFISAIVWILAQSSAAISAIVSKYLGAKKLDKIATLPAQIIAINVLLSVVIYLLTVVFAEAIFRAYNAEGLILEYSQNYFKIRALGFPLTLFVFSSFGIFRGLQNTFWPMVISILGASLNIGLDIILVYGIEGIINPMHIEGAAWASVFSQIVMAILTLGLLIKKTPFSLKLKFPFNKEIKNLIQISFNLIIRAVVLNIALFLANSYATKYGNHIIAAQTIAFQIWLFFAFFIDGYASVGNIVSGKLLGEKNFKMLSVLSIKLSRYSVIISVVLAIICGTFYYSIGKLFTEDDMVLASFYSIFWMVLLMQPINAIAFVFDGIFKGLAEAVTLRNLLLVSTFLGFIPVLLIGDYYDLQLYAIWMAFTVWMILRAGILILKFRRRYLLKNP
jgi:putative MATE family efflux protein